LGSEKSARRTPPSPRRSTSSEAMPGQTTRCLGNRAERMPWFGCGFGGPRGVSVAAQMIETALRQPRKIPVPSLGSVPGCRIGHGLGRLYRPGRCPGLSRRIRCRPGGGEGTRASACIGRRRGRGGGHRHGDGSCARAGAPHGRAGSLGLGAVEGAKLDNCRTIRAERIAP